MLQLCVFIVLTAGGLQLGQGRVNSEHGARLHGVVLVIMSEERKDTVTAPNGGGSHVHLAAMLLRL